MRVGAIFEKKFSPLTLSIVFESREEVDRFHAIFRHVDICKFLDPKGRAKGTEIRQVLETAIGHMDTDDEFDELIKLIKEGR